MKTLLPIFVLSLFIAGCAGGHSGAPPPPIVVTNKPPVILPPIPTNSIPDVPPLPGETNWLFSWIPNDGVHFNFYRNYVRVAQTDNTNIIWAGKSGDVFYVTAYDADGESGWTPLFLP